MNLKKIFLLAIIAAFTGVAHGQDDSVKVLALHLENYEYPFPVKYITLHLQKKDYSMAYMDVKPDKPNGKNIVLLHGKNFNGAYWETTAKALSGAGFRVIIPDQIGFGKSSKPVDFQYSLHQLAENTKSVLDSLNIKKTLVLGHSMGGMLATRFTLMYPETTEKLVLVDPIGLEDYKLKVPYKSVDFWYKNELKKNYSSIKKYMRESYYHGTWDPSYEPWAKILAGWTLNINYPLIAWNAALTYDMIYTQPVCYEFKNIKVPTLLIIGKLDKTALGKPLVSESVRKTMGNYPQLGKETQKTIPNCQLVEIDGTGHLPHIEAFDKFIKPLMDFVKD